MMMTVLADGKACAGNADEMVLTTHPSLITCSSVLAKIGPLSRQTTPTLMRDAIAEATSASEGRLSRLSWKRGVGEKLEGMRRGCMSTLSLSTLKRRTLTAMSSRNLLSMSRQFR